MHFTSVKQTSPPLLTSRWAVSHEYLLSSEPLLCVSLSLFHWVCMFWPLFFLRLNLLGEKSDWASKSCNARFLVFVTVPTWHYILPKSYERQPLQTFDITRGFNSYAGLYMLASSHHCWTLVLCVHLKTIHWIGCCDTAVKHSGLSLLAFVTWSQKGHLCFMLREIDARLWQVKSLCIYFFPLESYCV